MMTRFFCGSGFRFIRILQSSFRKRNQHKGFFLVGDFQISLPVPILEPEVGEFGLFGHTYAHLIDAYKISSRLVYKPRMNQPIKFEKWYK